MRFTCARSVVRVHYRPYNISNKKSLLKTLFMLDYTKKGKSAKLEEMSLFKKLTFYKPEVKNMIGIFDSGLGGLITLKTLIKELPDYNYIYFGDTAYLPYGDKSQKIIHQRTLKAVDFLFKKGC